MAVARYLDKEHTILGICQAVGIRKRTLYKYVREADSEGSAL
jgi:hypothetical protein